MNKKKKVNWGLLAKYLDKKMDDQELQLMEEFIRSDAEYDQIISEVQQPWNALKKQNNMIEVNTDSAWEKLKNRIEKTQTEKTPEKKISSSHGQRIIPYFLQIAAVLVIVTGLSFILYRTVIHSDKYLQTLKITSGSDQSKETTLPDGSTVLLKANSRLKFEHQASGIREVVLDGEAYFDVAHNPDEPFIVHAKKALVQVLGTSFCIRVDHENNQVKVLVESGRVSLSDRSNKERSLVIEPGYIGIVTKDGIELEENQNINYLSWKTKKLVFRETRFEDVINDLNHTFETNIVYGDTRLAGCRFTGTFYNQPIDTLLQVLKTAFNLDIEYNRSQITLVGEGCD